MKTNNIYSIDILVQDILRRKYPFEDEGNSLNYSLFNDWDKKLVNPFFYLNKISNSNDYMTLHIATYIIENMALDFLQNNREEAMCIVKRLFSKNIQRLQFHLLREIILLMKNKEDFIFYLKILNETCGILQNQAIFLLKNLEKEKIVTFKEISEEDFFDTFLITKKNYNFSIHEHIMKNKSDLYKKLYTTGLYRNDYKKSEIFSIINEYQNNNLMDYIYVYLD